MKLICTGCGRDETEPFEVLDGCPVCGATLIPDRLEDIIQALKEYQSHNHLNNDMDAYLWELASYALGENDITEKPICEDSLK